MTIAKVESKPVDPAAGDPGRQPPTASPAPKSLLPIKYSHPMQSDLKATVEKGKENEFTFELKD